MKDVRESALFYWASALVREWRDSFIFFFEERPSMMEKIDLRSLSSSALMSFTHHPTIAQTFCWQ
ncbi:MAG: hypothetical protein JSS93_05270 [Bacteroidetes bacterium]|nr:hypothetical protein [Bacteroidota bacterium]